MGLNASHVYEFRNSTKAELEVAVYHHLPGHRGAQEHYSAGRARLSPGEAYCLDLQRSSRFGFNLSFGDHPFALVRLLDAAAKLEVNCVLQYTVQYINLNDYLVKRNRVEYTEGQITELVYE